MKPERHLPGGRLEAVLREVVRSTTTTVVGEKDDDRVVKNTFFFQQVDHIADRSVHRGHDRGG